LTFFALAFFFVVIAIIVVFLPKILRGKEPPVPKKSQADFITESFQVLGNELKSLREQLILKERLATLGEVSAGIAHEFRNPMAVIMGYAKLLLKGLDESDSRREIVRAIINEIDTMNRVMEELLKFSKSEPLNKTDVDLVKMLSEIVHESIRPEAVNFESAGAFVTKADETLLRQAVKNLMNNALYAGEKAWVGLKEGQSSGKRGIFIEVSDNGKGVSAADMQKIFLPFYSTKQDGLGIGLSLVQKIAMAHGGSVDVRSDPGKGSGSTFRMFLPY
jgi:two-component system, NtrC family, sensor histidine kinase HydH